MDGRRGTLYGWGLILGASSGFGEATALTLAREGMHIFGVHLDRRATLENVGRIIAEIKTLGREAVFFNVNAADAEKRQEVLEQMEQVLADRGEPGAVKVLLHSLAFGALRPIITENPKEVLTQSQMEMTLDVMANSLVYWVQDLVRRQLMGPGNEKLVEAALAKNPHGRLTTPADVAAAIAALSAEGTHWITGNIIGVDGGEDLTG